MAADAMGHVSKPWLKEMESCVDRVMWKGECIGTVCRISADGVLATARHCIAEGGKCLEGLSAFGGDVTFIAAFRRVDVALFRGPPGLSLSLATGVWTAGCACVPVQLVSYPLAIDEEFGQSDGPLSYSSGQISGCASNGFVASADYSICEEQRFLKIALFHSSSWMKKLKKCHVRIRCFLTFFSSHYYCI